jgi:NAD(P)-dependent dehydrogenase (short-subunit alcohol dehydrogenase family)
MTEQGQSMRGRVCLVTGATSGIGAAAAEELATLGATVLVAGRDAERAAATVERIRQRTGGAAEYLLADLSSQQEVRRLAEAVCARHERLHVLVNNAGAVFTERRLSPDGLELTFALNHLAYFLLTGLLLDTLQASAPARIVNVASDAHQAATIDFDDLQAERGYSGFRVYGRSKLANLLFTYELARRLEGTGVTVNALHPGLVASRFATNLGGLARRLHPLARPFMLSPAQGARTIVYLASSPEVQGVTGRYFVSERDTTSSKASYDRAAAERLWQVSATLVGL